MVSKTVLGMRTVARLGRVEARVRGIRRTAVKLGGFIVDGRFRGCLSG